MRAKKIAKNASASFITQIVNIITNFILPPLIIGTYGSKINGLVTSTKQLMSYVSLVGAGISVAITQSLYKPIAEKDHRRISGVVNAAGKMFTKAGILFTVIALIISIIYPLFLSADDIKYLDIVLLTIVMSIQGMSEFFVVGKLRTLLYADQKSYVTSLVQALGLILSFLFAFALIRANVNIILVQLASSFVYIFRLVALSLYVKRNYKYLDYNVPPIESATKKRNDAFIHQITGLATLSSQAVILATFVGLEVASIYAVYNVVFSGLQSILAQVVNSVAPFLGRTKALGQGDKLKDEFNKVEFMFNLLLSFIYSVSSVMIIPFITLYVGNVSDINYIDYGVATLFIIVSFFNTSRLPAQSMINVAGHFKQTRSRAIIEAISCILLQLIFVKLIGIYGVLLGTAISLGWRSLDIITYTNKYIIKQNNKTSILRIIKVPLISTILILLHLKVLYFDVSGFLNWTIWALIYSIFSFIVIFIVNYVMERKVLFGTLSYIYNLLIIRFKKA